MVENNIIQIKNLKKSFSGKGKNRKETVVKEVISDISLDIKENEFVVLLGPSECGKTTLLKMIAGLVKADEGSIKVSGKEVDGTDKKVGMVFQTMATFPWMKVIDNVSLGGKINKVDEKTRLEEAQRLIDLVGLTGFENSYPRQLSGGMKQRVGIARAYANKPDVLLMDEPFGHLDAQTRYQMEGEILSLWEKEKKTVVFVTNNMEEAIYLADRIILLTNCPSTKKEEYIIDLPRPRDYTDEKFLKLRDEITKNMDMIPLN